MEKKTPGKRGRPPKYGPDGPLKRSARRKLASAVNKDGSLRKVHLEFTVERQRVYLEKLAETGLKGHAARHVGVSREIVRIERKRNPAFEELEQEALDFWAEGLEAEAVRRARDGVQVPVYYKGAVAGHVTEFSDRLMEVLLRGRIPEKYGQRLTGGDNISVSGVLVINQRPSADDWESQAGQAQLPAPIDGGELVPIPREKDE